MDRRKFLGTMTAATILSSRLGWAAASHHIEHLGVQLYTVRKQMKDDFEGTLAKVAAAGYREVEFAGYFDHSSKDVRAILDRHGLIAPSAHIPYKSLSESWPKVLEDSKVIGHKYIINAWVDEQVRNQPDGWKHVAETFNRAGEASKKAGIQFAYHNHWIEFRPVDGKLPYDILLQECDPNLVKMEMDLCWIIISGHDPVPYFQKYPGRFPLVHVKDMKKLPAAPDALTQKIENKDMTEVGSGVIDWKKIFAHSEAGIKYYIVEHDDSPTPFESIKTSYQYLKNLKF
jgi:sugar phosphate isomerase/epimerase